MPHYKMGKQEELLSFKEVQEKVAAAKRLGIEALAFFWLLYYVGSRKSEMYERDAEKDCRVTEPHFILDIFRKKGSAQTDPLEIPLWWPGMDLVCEQLRRALKRRKSRKLIERWDHGKRITSRVKAKWLFPHIHRTWAGEIVKTILGDKYYPHFLRLNRLTEIGTKPGANFIMMKSFSGIKSMRVVENNYMGKSKREQRRAIDFIGEQINKEE